jgi:ferritin-like metal-binding protein YciE
MVAAQEETSMAVKTTQEKFLFEVSDIYDAENRFLEGMQLMARKASDKTLQTMIQDHIQQTEGHIKNLDQVYSVLGEKPERHTCDAASGLVTEARKSMDEAGTDPIRDCLIGAAAAKNEHYEIASYRGLIASARGMGRPEIVSLLEHNLWQEEQTAHKLEQSAPQLLQHARAQESQ